jgi:hypothetical protein
MESPAAGSLLAGGGGNKRDGKWVDAGSWTECDAPCNGGKQFKERFCIPPAGGGKGCRGPTRLERMCNTNECGANAGGGGGAGGMVPVHNLPTQTLPMSIEMKQVSKRPQRYEECVIREGDICIVRDDMTGFPIAPRLPARAVLNLDTFSIYENSNFDSIHIAFTLKDMIISQ